MISLVVSTIDAGRRATISRAVIWLNVVQLRSLVPVIGHIIIRLVLIVQCDKEQGHINVRGWRNANQFVVSKDLCGHFSHILELTEGIVLIHAVLLFEVV